MSIVEFLNVRSPVSYIPPVRGMTVGSPPPPPPTPRWSVGTLRKILTIHYSYLTQTPLNAVIVVNKKWLDYSSFENKVKDRRLGCQITITFSVSYAMF